jgi:predicted nucleic acid-binding Zn ribbon protein
MGERPYDPIPIGRVLDDHTRRYGMGAAQQVGALFASWPRIVGDAIAEHVEPVSLRNGVLKLVADSPTWATEINYLREQIRAQANQALGGDVIKKVEVGAGTRRSGGAAPRTSRREPLAGGSGQTSGSSAERAPADDPMTAFERARAAWLRRRSRRG